MCGHRDVVVVVCRGAQHRGAQHRGAHLGCVLIRMLPSVVVVAHEGEHVPPLQDKLGVAVLPIVILGLG